MFTVRNVVIAIVVFALLALGVNAFAHRGMGWGGGGGHHGPGWHHRGGYGPCTNEGPGSMMNKEEYTQLEEKRAAFLEETRDIRASLVEKGQALHSELAKDQPDADKASLLQKEISDLQGQFDQKRIDHILEMRKLNPKAGRGFKRGGPMMGKGFGRGGYCWE